MNLKKTITSLFILSLFLSACNKDQEELPTYQIDGSYPVSAFTLFQEAIPAATSVKQTSDGGSILIGNEMEGIDAIQLTKLDDQCNLSWTNIFRGNDNNHGYDVVATRDGGYIIAGGSRNFGNQSSAYIIKTDQEGTKEWEQAFGGEGADGARSIVQTADGGYIFVGFTETSLSTFENEMYIVHLDEFGEEVWSKTIDDLIDGTAWKIIETNVDEFLIVGSSNLFDNGALLFKMDIDSNILWKKQLDEIDDNNGPIDIIQTNDHGFLLLSKETINDGNTKNLIVSKMDANGEQEWSINFAGERDHYGHSVFQTQDNGFLILGSTSSYGNGNTDILLIKTNELGETIWTRTYGGVEEDSASNLFELEDGSLIIFCTVMGNNGEFDPDLAILKTNAEGIPE